MYKYFFKRFFDFFFALVALLLLAVPLLIVAFLLYLVNKKSGIFFIQERPGLKEKIFHIVKFKTMTDERDSKGCLLPDAQRLTKLGRFIRSTSIDELPQIWNVLIGDMSFIGPRPLVPLYLPYYSDTENLRHAVRPGITGWAQVNGRKSISWNQKLAYDVEYVKNLSLTLDIKIFFLTIFKVFKRENVGVDTSGIINFHEYRIAQWKAAGRQDLIDEAETKRNRK